MDEFEYRQWLHRYISGRAGNIVTEDGQDALWLLETKGLEGLYMAMTGSSPRRDYFRFKEARGG